MKTKNLLMFLVLAVLALVCVQVQAVQAGLSGLSMGELAAGFGVLGMLSSSTTATTNARTGVPSQLYHPTSAQNVQMVARDTVTMGTTEVANNAVQLFGAGLNLNGCRIIPETIRVRTLASPAGAISYVAKIERRTVPVNGISGTADVTGNITLNGTVQTATAAAATPQTPLAVGETLWLVLTTVTTHVAGKQLEIEVGYARQDNPTV